LYSRHSWGREKSVFENLVRKREKRQISQLIWGKGSQFFYDSGGRKEEGRFGVLWDLHLCLWGGKEREENSHSPPDFSGSVKEGKGYSIFCVRTSGKKMVFRPKNLNFWKRGDTIARVILLKRKGKKGQPHPWRPHRREGGGGRRGGDRFDN